ncbi:EAL domain-containing protein [Hyphomicrobium sp.]|uniref:EAL domain-containing protein n=1 Tax=Hyphomicrobium sp. TaxID=82 RepID=UPI002D7A1BCF|nr:EAL domain-containing protein [Hyphomicrobium sp.]HET6390085.1 EAL domain-containing protein [Hyphomicrobium sp.]
MTKQDNSKPQVSVAPTDTAAPSQALGPAPAAGPAAPPTGDASDGGTLEPQSRDGLIVASIVIVSAAIGMMCFAQIGLSLHVSIATGVIVLALSMLLHKHIQKSAQIAQLKAELARTRHETKPSGAKASDAKAAASKIKAAPVRPAVAGAGASTSPSLPVGQTPGTPESRIRELSRDIGNIVPRPDVVPVPPLNATQPKPAANEPMNVRPMAPADAAAERGSDKAARTAPPRPVIQQGLQPSLEMPPKAPLVAANDAKGRPAFAAPVADRPAPPAEPTRERWSFRRRVDAQPQQPPVKGLPGWPAGAEEAPASNVAMTIEGDLELVQRKIKELADEVNAAEAMRPAKPVRTNDEPKAPASALEDSIGALRAVAASMRQRPGFGDFVPGFDTAARKPAPAVPAPAAAAPIAPPVAPAPAALAVPPAPVAAAPTAPAQQPYGPPAPPEPALSQGLGELVIPATAERIAGFDPDDTVTAGQDFDEPSFELPLGNDTARQDGETALPELTLPDLPILEFSAETAPTPELPPRAAAIARAIEDESIEVMLGPIVTLAEHSVGHYEMTTTLRSSAGDALEANEDDFALIGELDSRFDIARLNRAAALAARMDARERGGSLLASFLGSSVTSRAFLESFANTYEARPRIAQQLVLTFSQRAIDSFTPSAWQALRDMHSFGFRFGLESIEHMGTDFAVLQQTGFRFVRFDAQTLLSGMSARDRFVPAEEILQRASAAGLSVVASGIADASAQKRLLSAGVLLGQGPLFGAPRQVNVDGSAGTAPAKHSAAA